MDQQPRDIAPALRKGAIWFVLIVGTLMVLFLKTAARGSDFAPALITMFAVGAVGFAVLCWLGSNDAKNIKLPHPADVLRERREKAERDRREGDIT
jgi:hypothetical protein